ncbi:hypothetical protein TRL7639_01355 [Falsiruegeria litorea R37]|uniref:Integral membrane protein n=1 Tax=Falsiruegeria litorea R37 TaxID=1200284 RepID=A0A1Y5S432_9RHOB|nr:DUF1036 domain-containing protein [Falsiruegeria litorea]SLN31741.1 hypothetical protein TRL7639_01355 [Falsiruegeria litorea R37]
MRLRAFAIGIGVIAAGPSVAGLAVCNDTTVLHSVAIGYKSDGDWFSQGWWNIEPDQCATVLAGDLANRYYYLLAKADAWEFDHGGVGFCILNDVFDITGDQDCEGRGYARGQFLELDTGKSAKDHVTYIAAVSRPEKQSEPAFVPPGVYGEPYSAAGNFQSCSVESGQRVCSLFAEGFQIFFREDGREGEGAFDFVDRFRPGSPVIVHGDLESVYDRSADLVPYKLFARGWEEEDEVLRDMQGKWQSRDDAAAGLTLEGSLLDHTYDGQVVDSVSIRVSSTCNDYTEGGPYLIMQAGGDPEATCYGDLQVDGPFLDMVYLPRGNILRYQRAD